MDDLTFEKLPARLLAEQVADKLGFKPHDIPILAAAKMLTPLGDPSRQSVKYYAKVVIAQLGQDVKWLHKATQVIGAYWHRHPRGKTTVFTDNEVDLSIVASRKSPAQGKRRL